MSANSQFTRRTMLLFGSTATVTSWARSLTKDAKFWDTKDPSQWSTDEIDRLVTKSPWAKEIKIAIPQPEFNGGGTSRSGGTGGGRPGGLSIPGMGGGRLGGLNIPGLGGGQAQPSAPKVELIVRWESAKPVLDALKTPLADVLADHYVVSLNGIPNIYLRDQTEEGSRSDSERFQARLTINGRRSIRSAVVQQAPGAFTQTLLFGFSPKELPLLPDDEVTFTTQIKRTSITAAFNLKEMTYRGALAV